MIKSVDPTALVVGPEEWGWSGYLFSGYDQQYGSLHGWSFLPDRSNHGGADYLPWLLDQLRRNHTATGLRTLDVFTVHYYPQDNEFSDDVSTAMQLRRNRSTRSLWDPELRRRILDQRSRPAHPAAEELGEHVLPRHRASASPSTTGAPSITSTAPPPRRTSGASSGVKGSTWARAGPRRRRARRPTRR